jgi:hypothetical protein
VTEAELRSQVVALAHRHGWRVFSLPIAKTRRPVKDAIGYPDLTLARKGEAIWIELKVDKGLLTTAQHEWLSALAPNALVVRPVDLPYVEALLA